MDEARLDGAGPDQRHLHHDVVQALGAGGENGLDLGARLDLEGTHGVAARDQVVRLRIVHRQRVQLQVLARALLDRVEREVHGGQATQPQEVELGHARRIQVVLVELQDAVRPLVVCSIGR
jgi:hypothetical protein